MNQFATIKHYDTAQDAFIAVIQAILAKRDWAEPTNDPTSVGSHFGKGGRKTKELICHGFAIKNGRARLIDCPPRRIDIAFAFANFIWTIAGNNDVSTIDFYNPKGVMFSGDGKHFAGALGHRMQSTDNGSQLKAVIANLKRDPGSRRAVIQFYSNTDSILRPRDTPCIIAMHFLIRKGKLLAIVNMRSQSALMVMPYDIILYTMLHELVSAELNVELGTYFHFCDSLHIYDDEIKVASAVISNRKASLAPKPMRKMPEKPLSIMARVCGVESRIREHPLRNTAFREYENLPVYWRDIIRVLVVGIAFKHQTITNEESNSVHAHYRRWFQPNG